MELKVNVLPTQTGLLFVINVMLGRAFAVMLVVILHPVTLSSKVIIVAPASTPVTTPVFTSIEALPGLLLLHVPGLTSASLSVIVEPTHTLDAPLIAGGKAFTVMVTGADDPQPVV